MYSILLQHLSLCYSSCVQSVTGLYEHHFVSELKDEYFSMNIVKWFFEWLSVTWQLASITA